MQIMDLWTDVNTVAADDAENSLDALKDQARAILEEKPEQLSDRLVNDYLKVLAAEDIARMDKETRAAYMEAAGARAEAARRSSAAAADFVDAEEADEAAIMYNMQAGTLDILAAALEEIARFQRSNAWRHYCKMLPDAAERIRTLNVKHGGILDVLHTLDTCRQLDKAAPFADAVVDAWKKSHDGDTPQFTTFYFDLLPDCLEAASGAGELPSVAAIAAKQILVPNGIVANEISEILPKAYKARIEKRESIALNVGRSKKKPCYIYVTAVYDADDLIFSENVINEFDRVTDNAFGSLYEAGNRFITSEMIARTMTGAPDSRRIDGKFLEAIDKSVNKQRKIYLAIDVSEQTKKFNIVDKEGRQPLGFEDFLISAELRPYAVNGVKKFGYVPHVAPLLVRYSQGVNQAFHYPATWLDIKKVTKSGAVSTVSVTNSRPRILIKNYLAARVQTMKDDEEKARTIRHYKRQQGRRIKFESIYKAGEVSTADRRITADARNFVFCVMAYYKAAKIIKDYKTDGNGQQRKAYTYIDITL